MPCHAMRPPVHPSSTNPVAVLQRALVCLQHTKLWLLRKLVCKVLQCQHHPLQLSPPCTTQHCVPQTTSFTTRPHNNAGVCTCVHHRQLAMQPPQLHPQPTTVQNMTRGTCRPFLQCSAATHASRQHTQTRTVSAPASCPVLHLSEKGQVKGPKKHYYSPCTHTNTPSGFSWWTRAVPC